MPTTRQRHMITESDDLARVLDLAAQRWPEHRQSRARLITDIAKEWAEIQLDDVERRRQAIREVAGSFTGLWPPGAIEELHNEWPQ